MGTHILKAQVREKLGKSVKGLRQTGLIPGVLYGHGIKNVILSIKKNDFIKVYDQAGSSSLVDLQIDELKPVKTIIHDWQIDPQTDEIIHVDFYQIKEGEKISTEVEIEFRGEAPAVKELGGTLVKNYDMVEIECLPKDLELIEKIIVDLSGLKAFNDAIHIKDLQVPSEIKIKVSPDEVVAMVAAPREEEKEEVKPVETVVMPEVVETGKEKKEASEIGEKEEKNQVKK